MSEPGSQSETTLGDPLMKGHADKDKAYVMFVPTLPA
jgi:hypothetical protein